MATPVCVCDGGHPASQVTLLGSSETPHGFESDPSPEPGLQCGFPGPQPRELPAVPLSIGLGGGAGVASGDQLVSASKGPVTMASPWMWKWPMSRTTS